MLPSTCRSLLAFALVFSISRRNLAFADSLIVDDWDPSLQYVGGWVGFKDEPAPSWDRTLTWSNISSSTVTYTFTGTSIEVVGAFRPVGVWSMQSQYSIDGGSPTTFVPPQEVSEETYNQSFFSSGTLSEGEHTLEVTNLGAQLWLDYFRVNNDGGTTVVSSAGSSLGASATTMTATVTQSTTVSISAGTTHVGTSSSSATTSASATSSTLPTASQLVATESTLNSTFQTTTSPSAMGDASPSSPLSSSLSPSSSDTDSPARGATATQEPSSAASHGVSTGLIAGVTVAGVAALAVLLAIWWWMRRRKQSGLAPWIAPYPFSRPPGPDASSRTETSFYANDASFRDSQYSATLLIGPRTSRPTSYFPSPDFVDSYGERSPQSPQSYGDRSPQSPHTNTHTYFSRRSTDGGVTIAGGPGMEGGGDAPSISDVQSIKSRLPPVYQAYGAGPA